MQQAYGTAVKEGGLRGKYIIQAFFPSRRCRGKWKINDPSSGGEKFPLSLRAVSFYAAEKVGNGVPTVHKARRMTRNV